MRIPTIIFIVITFIAMLVMSILRETQEPPERYRVTMLTNNAQDTLYQLDSLEWIYDGGGFYVRWIVGSYKHKEIADSLARTFYNSYKFRKLHEFHKGE